jgi:hypothetical protein
MSEKLILQNLISESISNCNSDPFLKRNEEDGNLETFVNNLVEKSGLTPIDLYPSVIMSYLNNEFELTFVDRLCKNLHVQSSINKHMLSEPDKMFRMINYIQHCINLTDGLLGCSLRQEGLKMLFKLFKDRKLFSYLNYIEADPYQALFIIKAVRQQLIGYSVFDFFEGTIDFPFSIVSKMIYEVYNNQNIFQYNDLVDFKCTNHAQIQVYVQPKLISLLIN